MGSASEVVHCYCQLASTLAQMLELARAKQWESLPRLDAECTSIIDRLRAIEPHELLEPLQLAHVHELLARIRADQAGVRGLVRPQLEQLARELHQLQQQQNLAKAYRPRS